MSAPTKSNKTPDLSDDEYMEQLHLLAQVVTTMPGATPQHGNVTTPAPIRARWAAYMISLGVRCDRSLATHGLLRSAGAAAGEHAPRTLQPLSRDDMWGVVKQTSPELYEKHQRGEATADDFLDGMSDDLKAAVTNAMAERQREIDEERRREEREKRA